MDCGQWHNDEPDCKHKGTISGPSREIGIDANGAIALLLRQHFEVGVSGWIVRRVPSAMQHAFAHRLRHEYRMLTAHHRAPMPMEKLERGTDDR